MAREYYYLRGDRGSLVTPAELKDMNRHQQRTYVLDWFHRNYEDPFERSPHDRSVDAFVYTHGGPYDAMEELWSEFQGIVDHDYLQDIADEIANQSTDWAPGPEHPRYKPTAAEPSDAKEGEPDLEGIIRDLEAGLRPSFGSEAEQQQRQELLARIAALENELAGLRPDHGGMGHNNPPEDEIGAAASELADTVAEITEAIKGEVPKDDPDALAVARSASRLQRIARWLAGKGETSAEEFARAFGKSLGAAAGVALVGVVLAPAIYAVVRAAARWLAFVTLGL